MSLIILRKVNIMNTAIFVVFLVAFLIRLISLNQSLWLDEAVVANNILRHSYLELVTKFALTDFHPPLYYLFMKLWTSLFGLSEIALRFPSVIFSLLTGVVIYKLAKLTNSKDQNLPFWATAFYLFNPLVIYYSQEARMYGAISFLLMSYLFLINKLIANSNPQITNDKSNSKFKITNDKHKREIVIMGLVRQQAHNNPTCYLLLTTYSVGFLSLSTFYGSVFFFVALSMYFLFRRNYFLFILNSVFLLLNSLLLSPLLFSQLTNAKAALSLVPNWSLVLGKANLKNLLLIFIKFTSGRISFEPKWFYYLVAGGWAGVCWSLLAKNSNDKIQISNQIQNSKSQTINTQERMSSWGWSRRLGGIITPLNSYFLLLTSNLYLFLLSSTLFLAFGVSFIAPMLQYFRFLYLVPLLAILLATGASKTSQRVLLLTGFVLFSLFYLLFPQFHREDWKGLAAGLPRNAVIVSIPSSLEGINYYLKGKSYELRDIRSIYNLKLKIKNLTVIPYTFDIYGIDHVTLLSGLGYMQIGKHSFRGVELEKWSLPLQE
jgi:4-amino-4-deoxy-L-arabinose transferase-like glycosyltransferase